MSLRANDCLGFTRKPGVFSQIELRANNGPLAAAYVGFTTIRTQRGNDIMPVSDVSPGVFSGIQLLTPGIYHVEVCGVYSAAVALQLCLVADPNVATSPSASVSFATSAIPTGLDASFGGTYIANGGEIIRVGTVSGVDTTANGNSIFKVTKIA